MTTVGQQIHLTAGDPSVHDIISDYVCRQIEEEARELELVLSKAISLQDTERLDCLVIIQQQTATPYEYLPRTVASDVRGLLSDSPGAEG